MGILLEQAPLVRAFQSAPFSGHRIEMKFYPPRPSQIRRLAAGVFLTRNILSPAGYRPPCIQHSFVRCHPLSHKGSPASAAAQAVWRILSGTSVHAGFSPSISRGIQVNPSMRGAAEYHSSGNWNQYSAKLPLRILSEFSHIKGDGGYSGD